jgi:tetratricopeptide (TPR) repeat protein
MQSSNEKARGRAPEDTLSTGEKVNDFVQKNRKPIFISMGAVVILLLGFIAVLSIMDTLREKDLGAVEDFNSRYETLKATITEDASAGDVEELLAEIEAFAGSKSGYAAGRAWAIIGSIHGDKKNWAAAETAWAAAAKAAGKTYLGPAALFNAAAAAEEQSKTAEAIDYYSGAVAAAADFPSAARAQFSIGRLREALNDQAAAVEAYRAVISGWPNDAVWTNLAHSRIIVLEAETAAE